MIKTTIKHVIVDDKITSSTKTVKLLGLVIYKKIHHYPDLEEFQIMLGDL